MHKNIDRSSGADFRYELAVMSFSTDRESWRKPIPGPLAGKLYEWMCGEYECPIPSITIRLQEGMNVSARTMFVEEGEEVR